MVIALTVNPLCTAGAEEVVKKRKFLDFLRFDTVKVGLLLVLWLVTTAQCHKGIMSSLAFIYSHLFFVFLHRKRKIDRIERAK